MYEYIFCQTNLETFTIRKDTKTILSEIFEYLWPFWNGYVEQN